MRGKSAKPNAPEKYGYAHVPGTPEPPPLAEPPFTLKKIRESVPAHCFNRSLLISFTYLAVNLAICAALFWIGTYIPQLPWYSALLAWPVYWFLQGVYMAGIWLIAHECGHHAFSDYQIVDDIVGLILHSSMLVPYFSWKITHGKHHGNTASMENDEHHIPSTRKQVGQWPRFHTALLESPIYNFFGVVLDLVFAWMPGYLLFNYTGPEKYRGKNVIHFSPTAAMFSPRQYNLIVISDLGCLLTFAGLAWLSHTFGLMNVIAYYGIPNTIVHSIILGNSFIQHTDVYVPRFRGEEWHWLRGALSTVDRSFGKWFDGALHHVNDTHVCHHLFPNLPFYHAVEATKAISKVLGKYHLKDNTPYLKAIWRAYRNCKFVEDDDKIVFCQRIQRFKNLE